MEGRMLGDGLEVSAIGLGCMGFSHAYGEPMEEGEATGLIRAAYDEGYTFFDTAEVYVGQMADGRMSINEELVGRALKDVRGSVQIATKFGITIMPDRSLVPDSRPETIRKSVEASLRKLGSDHIDLYYQHRVDPSVEPETVAEVMKDLIREGKILHWGISECGEDYLRRADAVCHVSAVQMRYSMMARGVEKLFPALEDLGIGLVAFSPLANGFLTAGDHVLSGNDPKDYRYAMGQYTDEGRVKGSKLLDLLASCAQAHGTTIPAISLAWMLSKKPWIVPIPGTRKLERMRENAGAAMVRLSGDELASLDKALDGMDFLVFGGSRMASKEVKV